MTDAERESYALTLNLAQRPFFCCCCWALSRQDARRTKRVLRLVRAVTREWEKTPPERRRRAKKRR